MVLVKDTGKDHTAVSFGGAYLATPNVGILGSHGAAATALARRLSGFVAVDGRLEPYAAPQSGIVVWRPRDANLFGQVLRKLAAGSKCTAAIAGVKW